MNTQQPGSILDNGKPDVLPLVDAAEQTAPVQEHDYVLIYKFQCLNCLHLIPTLPEGKAYKECHFKTGNEDCPAAKLRIAVGVNIERTARILFKAFKESNLEKMQRMNKKLATKDPIIVGKILALVQQMIKES